MTTDDLKSEGQTSVSSRSARPLLLGLALCLTSLPAWSQTAPNRSDVTPAPVAESTARPAAKAEAAAPQRSRVDAAASATLAALLPHLAANDTIPLMDRSAVVAGDLSRLLANYDTSSAANGSVVGHAIRLAGTTVYVQASVRCRRCSWCCRCAGIRGGWRWRTG